MAEIIINIEATYDDDDGPFDGDIVMALMPLGLYDIEWSEDGEAIPRPAKDIEAAQGLIRERKKK